MSWADIDFDFIKSNYITRGPAEVSFGDYLNQFAMAAKEKFNMLKTPAETLPDYEFGPNHTRDLGSSTSTFWSQYQEMITDYSRIWDDYKWYSADVLTDTGAPDQYRLTDTDLTNIITVPTWDIIKDTGRSNKEAFTADVLNALYEIYKLTQYQEKNISTQGGTGFVDGFYTGPADDIGLNTITRLVKYGYHSDPGRGELKSDFNSANNEAYTEMSGTWTNKGIFIPTNKRQVSYIYYNASRFSLRPLGMQWEAVYRGTNISGYPVSGLQGPMDGSEIVCFYKDLDDNKLEMNMSTQLSVLENRVSVSTQELPGSLPRQTTTLGPFYNELPQVNFLAGAAIIKASPKSISHNTQFGSKYTYSINPNGGSTVYNKQSLQGTPPANLNITYGEDHILRTETTNRAFVDLNNIGLEFYIAP